jgi:hypothetical protein
MPERRSRQCQTLAAPEAASPGPVFIWCPDIKRPGQRGRGSRLVLYTPPGAPPHAAPAVQVRGAGHVGDPAAAAPPTLRRAGSRPTTSRLLVDRRGQAGKPSSLYPAPLSVFCIPSLLQWWAGAISDCYGPCDPPVGLGPTRCRPMVTVFRRRQSWNHFRNSLTISRIIRFRNSGFF